MKVPGLAKLETAPAVFQKIIAMSGRIIVG
jgi:hypothetical protein